MNDQQAIERYRYMLRTAPPDDIERAHEEAFERLTPEQRQMVLRGLADEVPPSEVGGDDPKSLARMATRAEMRQPGTIERTFGGARAPGLGSIFLSTLAGAFVGTAIADAFFDNDASAPGSADSDTTADAGGTGEDSGADGEDGGDFGGDGGDFGGDFGGGDFGGGDFGGGDFGG
jgi:hypothetical protein